MNSALPDILLVENHRDTLRYISKYLRQRGYEVREATDMASALQTFRKNPAQVLLSDIGLPDGDGWELLRRLRDEGHAPFAISMSGFGLDDDGRKSLSVGYHRHLLKPFQMADLLSLLQEVPSRDQG